MSSEHSMSTSNDPYWAHAAVLKWKAKIKDARTGLYPAIANVVSWVIGFSQVIPSEAILVPPDNVIKLILPCRLTRHVALNVWGESGNVTAVITIRTSARG